jgi:hypothetical protein
MAAGARAVIVVPHLTPAVAAAVLVSLATTVKPGEDLTPRAQADCAVAARQVLTSEIDRLSSFELTVMSRAVV